MTEKLKIKRGTLAKTGTVEAEELAVCDHPDCSAVASRDVYWGDLKSGVTVKEIKKALKEGKNSDGYDLHFSYVCKEHFRNMVSKISHQKNRVYLGWSTTPESLRR